MRDPTTLAVAVCGQPFWTARLAASVRRHAPDLPVVDVGGRGVGALVRLLRATTHATPVVAVRVGYRPGAPTLRGRGFDAGWAAVRRLRPAVRSGYFWIGTDVTGALDDEAAGRHTGAFATARARDAHCAGAPWLADELAGVGVDAAFVPFPVHVPAPSTPPPFPERFTAVTYIPDARPELYGGDCLLAVAAALPQVRFLVTGGEGTWARAVPDNVEFAGRLPSLVPAITDSQVVLRLVRHDGLGATVREALALGRHALYSYPLPGTVRVDPGRPETVEVPLRSLAERHARGELRPNDEGCRHVADELGEAACVRRFAGWVRAAADLPR